MNGMKSPTDWILKPFVLLSSSILSFMFLDIRLYFYFTEQLSPDNLVDILLMSLIYCVLRIGFLNLSVSTLVGIEDSKWSRNNAKCLAFAAVISGAPILTFFMFFIGPLTAIPGVGRIMSNLPVLPFLFIIELFRVVYFLRVKRSCSDSTTLPKELVPLKKAYILCALSALSFSLFDVSLSNIPIRQSSFNSFTPVMYSITPVVYLLLFVILRTGLANILTDWVIGSRGFKIGFKDMALAFVVYSLPLDTVIHRYSADPFVFYLPTYARVFGYLVITGLPSLLSSLVSMIFLTLVYDFPRLILLLKLKRSMRCVRARAGEGRIPPGILPCLRRGGLQAPCGQDGDIEALGYVARRD